MPVLGRSVKLCDLVRQLRQEHRAVVAAQTRCSRIHGDQIGESVIRRWTIDYAETIRGSGNGTMN